MKVFAHGHRMYYNEINIRDDPLCIDVYLLREELKPKRDCKPEERPKDKQMSLIAGHVFNIRTKGPVPRAFVCVIPLRIIRERLDNINLDVNELSLDDLDLDGINLEDFGITKLDLENLEFISEIDVDMKDWDEDDYNKDDYNKDDYNKDDYDMKTEKGTRQNEKGNGYDEKDRDPDGRDRYLGEGEQDQKLLQVKASRFCSKTDEKGFFKLMIPPGAYVMLVKARGYKLFAHKFMIKPAQKMMVRVPLTPFIQRDVNLNDEGEPLTDRPSPENGDSDENIDKSDTANLGSSAGAGTVGSSSVLSAVLGILIIIAVILFSMVWRRQNLSGKSKKNRKK
jgi:hypothetical protein